MDNSLLIVNSLQLYNLQAVLRGRCDCYSGSYTIYYLVKPFQLYTLAPWLYHLSVEGFVVVMVVGGEWRRRMGQHKTREREKQDMRRIYICRN